MQHPHQIRSQQFMCCQERCLAKKQAFENEKMFQLGLSIPHYKPDSFYMLYDALESNRQLLCSVDIEDRGGNNVVPQKADLRSPGFLVQPCPNNTFMNHLVCDENKCCSKQHQLFNNWTNPKGTM